MILNDKHTIILIICMSFTTIVLRLLPFFVFSGDRKVPSVITYLGKYLPPAIIGLLIVYCFQDVSFFDNTIFKSSAVIKLICVIIVFVVQYIKKNSLFSILVGTIIYMVLLRII